MTASTALAWRYAGTNKRLNYRRGPARRSVSVEILAYYCTNNANRSRVSLRSTFSNCHVLFRYLHSLFGTCIVGLGTTIAQRPCNAVRVINRFPYNHSCWCQLDSNCDCDQPTSTTTNVVDDTAYYSASAQSWTWTTAAKRFHLTLLKESCNLLKVREINDNAAETVQDRDMAAMKV